MIAFDVHRLLSTEGLVAAVLGGIGTYGVMTWRLNMGKPGRLRFPQLRRQFWAWVIMFAALLYIGYQNQVVRNDMSRLVVANTACQEEFRAALAARSTATASDLKLVNDKIDAGARWLGQLLQPPAPIAALAPDSPERRQWAIGLTGDYLNGLNEIRLKQIGNDEVRRLNPLPEPCTTK